jgi:hypothetical protein
MMPGEPSTNCPECGSDLFVPEFGCPVCRHGKKRGVARVNGVIPFAVAFGIGVIGAVGVILVGPLEGSPGPLMNAFAIGMSMIFGGTGVFALTKPTSLMLSENRGTDAFGQQQWGPTRRATTEQGLTQGAIFVVVALFMLLLGIFLGRVASP